MAENLDKIKRVLVEQLGIRDEEITLDANLIDDFGADSLDLVELVMSLEEEFEIDIIDEEAEKFLTVQDIVNHIDARIPPVAKADVIVTDVDQSTDVG